MADTETGYIEECCWAYPNDRQYCRGRNCPCGCHAVVADHPLQPYCPPEQHCEMIHVCHRLGCFALPDQHPKPVTAS